MKLHKELDADEEAKFRQWAHDHYIPFEPIDPAWHPVVAEECKRINEECQLKCETFPIYKYDVEKV